ncbi:MAG TPA: diaminopimelate epimerase [Chthoniobacterales bacterium]
MRLHKYQALGNDYLVLHDGDPALLTGPRIQKICHRHFGVGSDGILVAGLHQEDGINLRILNPDGSEAEKSGNGLRIFARYLWDQGLVGDKPFVVQTAGGRVRCHVQDHGRLVFVEMGAASFSSDRIPVLGPAREVVAETIEVNGRRFQFTAVTVGNPHCVIPVEHATPSLAAECGPPLEVHPLFPNRTNVQFMQVLDQHHIRIEIWERGAGYTLASGTSSCAAAAAAVRLGLCVSPLTVEMPGGQLTITVGKQFDLTMLGPARKVAEIEMAREAMSD